MGNYIINLPSLITSPNVIEQSSSSVMDSTVSHETQGQVMITQPFREDPANVSMVIDTVGSMEQQQQVEQYSVESTTNIEIGKFDNLNEDIENMIQFTYSIESKINNEEHRLKSEYTEATKEQNDIKGLLSQKMNKSIDFV